MDTPRTFPVVDHEWDLDDMVGQKEIVAELQGIEAVLIEMKNQQGKEHADRTDNPHRVTKGQTGLSDVENYPPSTQPQSEKGEDNASYTTPLRVRQAIEALAIKVINQHLNDLTNPHQTTKSQIGLGDVENFPTSTPAIAKLGESNRHFLTPLTGKALFTEFSKVYDNHLKDFDNPHRITPQGIGAATRADIDNALQNFSNRDVTATDTAKFGGQTPAEWQEGFINHDNLLVLIYAQTDAFKQGIANTNQITIPDLKPTT